MNYTAVIVAAGKGLRSGLDYNKVLHPVGSKRLIDYTLDPFLKDPECTSIVLVHHKDEADAFRSLEDHPKIVLAQGGEDRQHSVWNGVKKAREDCVMIHDGARPFVSAELLERIKAGLKEHPAVFAAVPIRDAIKYIDDNNRIISVDRSRFLAAQTPQAFKTELILKALEKVMNEGLTVLDDIEAIGHLGIVPAVVEGDFSNIKITDPQDLEKLGGLGNG